MWADTLLAAERAHLFRLAIWAMASVVAGTAVFLLPHAQRGSSALLRHFALQSVAWGTVELVIVWAARSSLGLRDLGGARQLERFVWLSCGLDAGCVAVGVTLAIACCALGRRLGDIGAGVGIVTQGAALLWLDLVFANALVGLV